MQPIWGAAIAVPIVVAKGIMSARGRHRRADEGSDSVIDEEGNDPGFVCERVCTSGRLLRRMGSLSKDPTPNTCVTVCGVSARDACAEACQRSVCAVPHQVPAWNESCQKRCIQECLKGRAS